MVEGRRGGGKAESEAGGNDGPQDWTLWAQIQASRPVLKDTPRPKPPLHHQSFKPQGP